jgi:hypothetical protein
MATFLSMELPAFPRGDDWINTFYIKDDLGQPVDITGYTYWMTLKSDPNDPDPGAGQQVIFPTAPDSQEGILTIAFSPEITNELGPGTYNFDIQQMDTAGLVKTLVIGRVRVVVDITRTTTV